MVVAGDKIQGGAVYKLDENKIHKSHITHDIFETKKVLVFGGPAPFSRLDTQQATEFALVSKQLLATGLDAIYGIYCQDAFVMAEFDKKICKEAPEHSVTFYGDGDAYFARGQKLEHNFTDQGLSMRTIRFAMIVNDGIVEKIFTDDFSEINNTSAESMLKLLSK